MRQLPIVMLIAGGGAVGICWGQPQTVGPLDLCTVAANIGTYNRQQVRVTAFLSAGGEQDVLYDPKCRSGEPLVYVSFNPRVTEQQTKALRRIVKKKRYALVTIEGTMHGPEPVQVDPKLPDWLKDRFKDAPKRYGHLDSMEIMIEVGRVVAAKEVNDDLRSKVAVHPIELEHERHHAVVADAFLPE